MHLTWQVALATDDKTDKHDSDLEIVRRAQADLDAFAPLYEG